MSGLDIGEAFSAVGEAPERRPNMETRALARSAVAAGGSLQCQPKLKNARAWRAPGLLQAPGHGRRVEQRGRQQVPGRQQGVRVTAILKGLGSVFSSDPSEKTRKKYEARVQQINALEPEMQRLTNEQLRAKTQEFQQRARAGESLDTLLVEAFAVRASPLFLRGEQEPTHGFVSS